VRGEAGGIADRTRNGPDRKTVARDLGQSDWMPYWRMLLVQTLLLAHMGRLTEPVPKSNFSAEVLLQGLRASRGQEIGYDTVRNTVRSLCAEATVAAFRRRASRPSRACRRSSTGARCT
jgi:hypothetical protein